MRKMFHSSAQFVMPAGNSEYILHPLHEELPGTSEQATGLQGEHDYTRCYAKAFGTSKHGYPDDPSIEEVSACE